MFSFDEDCEQIFDYPVLCRTDIGGRSENQDTCGSWQNPEWLIALVADGAGGHAGGKEASRLAVSGLMSRLQAQPSLQPAEIRHRVLEVNEDILQAQRRDASLQGMHTTIVGLVVHKTSGLYVVFHCGDSRAYSCLDGALTQLTRDHSLRALMQVDLAGTAHEGGSDSGGQADFPGPARHLLASALGEQSDQLMVDVSVPAFFPAGTLFLLCTDGFWEPFEETHQGHSDGQKADLVAEPCAGLFSLACIDKHFNQLIENQPPGSDNLSVLAVAV